MKAGEEPIVMGHFPINAREMMFVQYMPVRMPGTAIRLPENLHCFFPLIEAAEVLAWPEDYIYLTAKRLYVKDRCNMNRPGWHIDGFGTKDMNCLWCDRAPTEFCIQPFDLSDDCDSSMADMEAQSKPENIRTYGANLLLGLDTTVVHRPAPNIEPGMRTFAKISISRDRYNLEGNAHNYLFDYDWPMFPRDVKRNHPHKETA